MFKVISVNLNGIRSAQRKGFFTWLAKQHADVVCLQETKAHLHQLQEFGDICPKDYYCYFFDAEKKGYSGVGIYSKQEPDRITQGFGFPLADAEGRYIQADFGKLSVASIYFPSGTMGELRQAVKYQFLDAFAQHLQSLDTRQRQYILCGDYNIAHQKIDIKNWQSNQKNTGFLPEERAWMDKLFGPLGWVDAFRVKNHLPDQYTWWSFRGQARAKNVGWRIDYQVISQNLKDKVANVTIYLEEQFSDHAPLIIEYAL